MNFSYRSMVLPLEELARAEGKERHFQICIAPAGKAGVFVRGKR